MMTRGNADKSHFLVLYASQTGQAKAIAEELTNTAAIKGLTPALFCFSQYEKKFSFESEKYVAIISSTTGEGEPPDSVLKFWRRIRRTTLPPNHLAHIQFAILGLGDSNYNNFCNFGKQLDRRLEELGAQHFYPSHWADDAVGLEVEAEPWMDGVIETLSGIFLNKSLPSAMNLSNAVASQSNTYAISTIGMGSTTQNTNSCMHNSLQTVANANPEVSSHVATASDVLNTANSAAAILPSAVCQQQDLTNNSSCTEDSLTYSMRPLCEAVLTVPVCPPRFLRVTFMPGTILDSLDTGIQNGCPFAGARSSTSIVPISFVRRLTCDDVSVKKTLEIELDTSACSWSYEPGDSIGVICFNNLSDVECLIERLGLLDKASVPVSLSLMEGTLKHNAAVPEYLPQKSTLLHLLQTCCEIREVPRKACLRAMVEFTSDDCEKRRLQELCSKQGSDHYIRFIRQPGICLMDLLAAFPSCQPPIDVVLEHLPRLLPRPYSVASSPLDSPGRLRFLFNVIEIPAGDGRLNNRRGVCTGWLSDITESLINAPVHVEDKLCQLALQEKSLMIEVFLRSNNFFRLPSNLQTPIIMVGPGTGIAPFIGFLKHRNQLLSQREGSQLIGEAWLFYGCRHRNLDYLYRSELSDWERHGVLTKACVCFSRDVQSPDSPRYVQDILRNHGKHLSSLIHIHNAMIYICGDAIGMAPQVHAVFKDILMTHQGFDESTATAVMTTMKQQKRYLEDIWL